MRRKGNSAESGVDTRSVTPQHVSVKATAVGSTVPRRQLGRELRRLREEAAVTVAQAAEALEWSGPKVWRIEKGAVPMRALDVEAMCRIYGAPPALTDALMALAAETRATGWWHAYGRSIPEWFDLYVGLEQAASALRAYEPELVPGLLQTEAYAREVVRAGRPGLPVQDVEQRVRLRLRRQRILHRPLPIGPPRLDVIIGEGALERMPGDPAIARAQLQHLVEMARRPGMSVALLPFSARLHRATHLGGFTILDFPSRGGRPAEPTTVYSEGLTGALYLDQPDEIDEFEQVWGSISDPCLDEEETIAAFVARAEEQG